MSDLDKVMRALRGAGLGTVVVPVATLPLYLRTVAALERGRLLAVRNRELRRRARLLRWSGEQRRLNRAA